MTDKTNLEIMEELGLLGAIDDPKPKSLEELKAMIVMFWKASPNESDQTGLERIAMMIEKIVEILDEPR